MELTKSLVRATSKGVLVNKCKIELELGGLATTIIMDVTSTLMERNYRSWEMLPNSGFLSKFSAKKEEREFQLELVEEKNLFLYLRIQKMVL